MKRFEYIDKNYYKDLKTGALYTHKQGVDLLNDLYNIIKEEDK